MQFSRLPPSNGIVLHRLMSGGEITDRRRHCAMIIFPRGAKKMIFFSEFYNFCEFLRFLKAEKNEFTIFRFIDHFRTYSLLGWIEHGAILDRTVDA